jgi:hypothetical protein
MLSGPKFCTTNQARPSVIFELSMSNYLSLWILKITLVNSFQQLPKKVLKSIYHMIKKQINYHIITPPY